VLASRLQAYQYVGPLLHITLPEDILKGELRALNLKYKQRIISLTYVFVPLALNPLLLLKMIVDCISGI
ncbi:hypothetical protein, partial [Escherichia coli]|uniref:hypothetical protein n=1 Tax=Escherichia coli TaxID=562 RepID=UPI001BC8B178